MDAAPDHTPDPMPGPESEPWGGPGAAEVVEPYLLDALAKARSVTLRLDRGWSRFVVRHGGMEMTVAACATDWVDARTGTTPTSPPLERAEALATLDPEFAAALGTVLRAGDRLTLSWIRNPPHRAHLRPSERVAVQVRVAHPDGTCEAVDVPAASVRTARPGRRSL